MRRISTAIFREYRRHGFRTALDDFGAGHSGLNLLAAFQPDVLKLDRALVAGIDASAARRAIVAGMAGICRELGLDLVAEGVETAAESPPCASSASTLMQGYLFARPRFEALPSASAGLIPALAERTHRTLAETGGLLHSSAPKRVRAMLACRPAQGRTSWISKPARSAGSRRGSCRCSSSATSWPISTG